VTSTRGEGIRLSLHYFNNFEDIDRFVEEMGSFAGAGPAPAPQQT